MSTPTAALKPRKSPRQARSAATVEALHTAAVQVLTREGLGRCTTTRVAARAGMSVGSLYQYYPNRDALLAAVLARHLDGVAGAVAEVCQQSRGRPAAEMARALVASFLDAKLRDPQESKALYAVAAERGGAELAAQAGARMTGAIAAMLASAPDARFADPAVTAGIAFRALAGPVRAVLEGTAPPGFQACLQEQLALLLGAYFTAGQGPAHTRPARAAAKRPPRCAFG
ncbi:TetR/AcrR family transcriptional regulator [Orrella sp. JC864]|uniref:TetR/AcrR family transcriptional regulator n=1 Tax=Orrella sp. JC864 TaxID=3120298 RepID=UPI00300B9A85